MKVIKAFLSAATVVLLTTTAARATVVDFVERNPDTPLTAGASTSYIHDFTDQGFVLHVTNYISGMLEVRLTDTTANEGGIITIGTQTKTFGNVQNNTQDQPSPSGTLVDVTLDNSSLVDLNADGKISVTITSTSGTFYFADSTLNVEAAAASVPEPMSLALLGAGFFGIGAVRRRKNV